MNGKLDPEERVLDSVFTQTSLEPYLKHDYSLHFNDGNTIVFDNYGDTVKAWYQYPISDYIEVLDHKPIKHKSKDKPKGF